MFSWAQMHRPMKTHTINMASLNTPHVTHFAIYFCHLTDILIIILSLSTLFKNFVWGMFMWNSIYCVFSIPHVVILNSETPEKNEKSQT